MGYCRYLLWSILPTTNWQWVLLEKNIYLPTPPYPQPQLKKVPESTRLAGRELNYFYRCKRHFKNISKAPIKYRDRWNGGHFGGEGEQKLLFRLITGADWGGGFPTPDYPWDLANSAYFTINAAKSSSTCRISLSRLVRAAGEHHAWSWQSPSFRNF